MKRPPTSRSASVGASRSRTGNRAAVGRKPVLALLGVKAELVPKASRADLKRADRYRQRRVREVAGAHGYASAGTCAVLGSAALVLASQRQVSLLAFKSGDPALHKLAADLAEKHSQLEIKAGFMAKDESAARPRRALPSIVDEINDEIAEQEQRERGEEAAE